MARLDLVAAVRTGLFNQIPTGDSDNDRLQANIRTAVDQLAADHDLLSVPVTALSATGAIAPGKSVVVYAGAPGAVLTLPLATGQGQNVAALILIANRSTGAVTVRCAGADLIAGAATAALPANGMLVLASDGISRWFTTVAATATSTSVTYTVFTATTNGLVPAPGLAFAQEDNLFLRSDGVWADPSEDITRKFRLLLKRYVTTLEDVPPGLADDEVPIALTLEEGN